MFYDDLEIGIRSLKYHFVKSSSIKTELALFDRNFFMTLSLKNIYMSIEIDSVVLLQIPKICINTNYSRSYMQNSYSKRNKPVVCIKKIIKCNFCEGFR